MKTTRNLIKIGLLGALLPLGACADLFEVDAPGQIADDDLNSPGAVPGLVVGMSYDFARAMNFRLWQMSYVSGDLWDGGSYGFRHFAEGDFGPEDVNTFWSSIQQARWVAEKGIERMQQIEGYNFEGNAHTARAYLFAGLANRLSGENFCSTAIDAGPEQPNTVHFERAEEQFTQAIAIGQATDADDVVLAAYGGRAAVRAWQNDWTGAVQDAQMVPVDFVYEALLHSPDLDNNVVYETYSRYEYTVYDSQWDITDTDGDLVSDDPRVPWAAVILGDGSVATGANGSTPHYQQSKYTDRGDDIPVVKGTEALLIRAEAALRSDDIPAAEGLMNQARAHYGMAALPAAATADIDAAWQTLQYERGAALWLEGRRLWDLRRWYAEGAASPAYNGFLEGRQPCFPISEEERRTNPNLGSDPGD